MFSTEDILNGSTKVPAKIRPSQTVRPRATITQDSQNEFAEQENESSDDETDFFGTPADQQISPDDPDVPAEVIQQ